MGLPHDGEEALLWLGRAARQLAEVVGDGPEAGSSGSAAAVPEARALPVLLSAGECRHILAQVCGGFDPSMQPVGLAQCSSLHSCWWFGRLSASQARRGVRQYRFLIMNMRCHPTPPCRRPTSLDICT